MQNRIIYIRKLDTMVLLYSSAFVLGLSGAMMPGPLLTYTIRKALAKGWKAGFIITAVHALLEIA